MTSDGLTQKVGFNVPDSLGEGVDSFVVDLGVLGRSNRGFGIVSVLPSEYYEVVDYDTIRATPKLLDLLNSGVDVLPEAILRFGRRGG